jgi:hypothetical protein
MHKAGAEAVGDLLSGPDSWVFVMVGREAFADVLTGLLRLDRKGLAQRALAEIVREMAWDGTCRLSREELRKRLKVAESNLSAALTELASEPLNAIIRERANGRLVIRVNPNLATMLRAGDRRKAQAEAPSIAA